jgi:hypothetical protein
MRFEFDCRYDIYVDHRVILDPAELAKAVESTGLPEGAFTSLFIFLEVGFEDDVTLSWRSRSPEGAKLSVEQSERQRAYIEPLIQTAWARKRDQDLDEACRAHAARRGWKMVEPA